MKNIINHYTGIIVVPIRKAIVIDHFGPDLGPIILSYLPIKDEFENMTLALNKKLIPFFGKIYPKLNYIDYKEINKFNDYDYHLPMGSLGLFFQKYVKSS